MGSVARLTPANSIGQLLAHSPRNVAKPTGKVWRDLSLMTTT